ncbi:MAG: signal peptidase II [Hyphomonadaceae bacterium JAD_PAG50586_4]|nr:MAG: signal peptidase II [Hyphomonadaceae bacterium JAD_PAG50586_4]
MTRLQLLPLVPAIVALDIATKAWARAALYPGEAIELLPFFDLTLSFNRGVAFGFLNAAGPVFVLLVTAAISAGFGVWFWREPRALTRLALALVLGGALGNFVDRLWRGAVTDFLDVHVAGLHWPAFNLADAAITCGALLLVVDMVRTRKEAPSA